MKRSESWKAIWYWAVGTILVFIVTALPAMLYLVAKVWGISPYSLSDLGSAWFFGSLTLAALPAFMAGLGVATDQQLKAFTDIGRKMLFLNLIVFPVLVIYFGCILLRRMCPSDKEEEIPEG